MLDIRYIKENPDTVKENMRNRQADFSIVDTLLAVEEKKRGLEKQIEDANRERNENAAKLQSLKDKRSSEAQDIIEKGKKLKEQLQTIEEIYAPLEKEYEALMLRIPNITDPTMPIGKSSDENVEIKVVGKRREFTFPIKDHVTLGTELDVIDIARSTKVSGSRFYYLKNEAVLLEFAIIMHLTNKLIKKGFTPMIPPILVKEKAMIGTGYFPMEADQVYTIESDNVEDANQLFLSGTGEVPTVSYHAGEILDESRLPLRYFAFSPCFRSEVGSWGKDVRGIKRVHQFDKLEMVVFSHPDRSKQILEELLAINEEFLQDLELPYHILNMCSGDVGYPTYKKYDVEVFIPSQNEYCETMSTSNIDAFQARRLNIKYRKADGTTDYIHTLNSTAAAMPRILIAILETYQQQDGTVKVPDVLFPYMQQAMHDQFIRAKE